MNKERKGVAIEYSGDVPRILAAARGILFDKLIEIAKINNITIYQDADLTAVLSELEVGSRIPVELYKALSEVLAFCYKVNIDFKTKMEGMVFNNA